MQPVGDVARSFWEAGGENGGLAGCILPFTAAQLSQGWVRRRGCFLTVTLWAAIFDHDLSMLVESLTLGGWLPPGEEISRSESYEVTLPEGLYDAHLLVRGIPLAQDSFAVTSVVQIFADGFELGTTGQWTNTVGGQP